MKKLLKFLTQLGVEKHVHNELNRDLHLANTITLQLSVILLIMHLFLLLIHPGKSLLYVVDIAFLLLIAALAFSFNARRKPNAGVMVFSLGVVGMAILPSLLFPDSPLFGIITFNTALLIAFMMTALYLVLRGKWQLMRWVYLVTFAVFLFDLLPAYRLIQGANPEEKSMLYYITMKGSFLLIYVMVFITNRIVHYYFSVINQELNAYQTALDRSADMLKNMLKD